MKATLSFDLGNGEETSDSYSFANAIKGSDYRCTIEEALDFIRSILKYGKPSENPVQNLEDLRKILSSNISD